MSYLTNFESVNVMAPHPTAASQPRQHHGFYPYTDNGGSILGIAGAEYTILAGDTRSTNGYSINSRFTPKLYPLGGPDVKSSRMVIGLVGYAADGTALKEAMETIIRVYASQHGRPMSINAAAQRLSHLLYSKRFFPFYVHAILGGLDEEGKGALYSYDPVGSYEREQSRAAGAASSLLTPVLDNQVNLKNHHIPGSGVGHDLKPMEAVPLELEAAKELVDDAFTSAVERHIEVGDYLQMMVITKDGIQELISDLKKD